MSADLDISKLQAALQEFSGGKVEMVIGFNAVYAAAVHEVLTNHHDVGQAKYLETALQEGAGLLEKSLAIELRKATSIEVYIELVLVAVRNAALQILGNAQQLTPVKTGFLQSSATWSEPQVV